MYWLKAKPSSHGVLAIEVVRDWWKKVEAMTFTLEC